MVIPPHTHPTSFHSELYWLVINLFLKGIKMLRRAGLSLELPLCRQVCFLVDADDGRRYFMTTSQVGRLAGRLVKSPGEENLHVGNKNGKKQV